MKARMLSTPLAAAFLVALSTPASLATTDAPDERAQERIAELEAQVAELEKSVDALGQIVEGTAHPINLGRTSLAQVSASSVNAARSFSNKYYGVLNAFDDGSNWIGKINYTYWLSSGDPRPWIEIAFDHPVSITSVTVEGAPPFTTRLEFAKGGEKIEPSVAERLELSATTHGVSRVRLTFGPTSGNTRVHEVCVMGYVPPGVEYTAGPPRVLVTEQEARVIAEDTFRVWTEVFLPHSCGSRVDEQDGAMVFTFHRNGLDFARVTVDMSSGQTEVEPLVRIVQSSPEKQTGKPQESDDDEADAPMIHRILPPDHNVLPSNR